MQKTNQISENVLPRQSHEISLKQLILSLRRTFNYVLSKWLYLVIGVTMGGVIGFYLALEKKTLYKSELTFVLESGEKNGGLSGYANMASQFGLNLGSSGGGAFERSNLLELMNSRMMIEKTLMTSVIIDGKNATLAEHYIDIKGLRNKWKENNPKLASIHFLPDANTSNFSLEQNSLITAFHNTITNTNLIVGNKDKKSTIMSISFEFENELFSKYFTEILAKEVSDFYIETKVKNLRNNITILKFQVDSVRRKFNSAVSSAASSVDANPNANPALSSMLKVPFQTKQVDAQANQAMLIQLMQTLTMTQNSLREEMPLIQIIDIPVLPLPKQDFSKLKSLIIGGVLGGILVVFFLVIVSFLKRVMSE